MQEVANTTIAYPTSNYSLLHYTHQAAQIMWQAPGRMRSTYWTGCDRNCPEREHVQNATDPSVDVDAGVCGVSLRPGSPIYAAAQIMWQAPGRMRSTYWTGCDRNYSEREHVQNATDPSVDVDAGVCGVSLT
ncbi:hypothetical protein JYU34_018051 [Plutella xylostella]|uniref:Uncharacterized protein n=1 Tax=Plutella xylostella TaxID=51655 RepID=A0ABQ7PZL9_PLUXY|nr:hypothetical protein JYU34_018051 [Plutella xylostella]